MAEENAPAPAAPVARPSRPMSEALLNDKVGFVHPPDLLSIADGLIPLNLLDKATVATCFARLQAFRLTGAQPSP